MTRSVLWFAHIVLGLVLVPGISVAQTPSSEAQALLDSIQPGPRVQGQGGARTAAPMRLLRKDGSLRNVSAPQGGYIPMQKPAGSATPESIAKAFLQSNSVAFGFKGARFAFQRMTITPDPVRTSVRLQQTYGGVPVFGGEAVVQVLKSDAVEAALTNLMTSADGLESKQDVSKAKLSAKQAQEIALREIRNMHSKVELTVGDAQLVIFDPALFELNGNAQLAWRINVTSTPIALVNVTLLIDAQTGGVSYTESNVHDSLERQILDADNTPGYEGVLARSEGSPPVGGNFSQDVNIVYDLYGAVYSFYENMHGRDSFDGDGAPLRAIVRFCHPSYECPFANAAFSSPDDPSSVAEGFMIFGDGWAGSDDVIGHELTHGVTKATSNLKYKFQPGAINESLSDMWGEWIDISTRFGNDTPNERWLIGEDLTIGVIRSMRDPTKFKHPDKMSSRFFRQVGEDDDHGGVHSNSGVGNKFCYLITDGDSFNGHTVEGMGIPKAAQLMYYVQTRLLHSTSNYLDLGMAIMQASMDLGFSRDEQLNVLAACLATEIVDAGEIPGPSPDPDPKPEPEPDPPMPPDDESTWELDEPIPAQPATPWHTTSVAIGCRISQEDGAIEPDVEVRVDVNGDGDYDDGGAEDWNPSTSAKASDDGLVVLRIVQLEPHAGTRGPYRFEWRAQQPGGTKWNYSGTDSAMGIEDDWEVVLSDRCWRTAVER